MSNCIFCQIIAGQMPCYKIAQDDQFLAFLDIFPFGEGHTLVIPKTHYTHIWDMEQPGDLFTFAAKIANHYREVYQSELCFSMIIEEGVPHAHLQLLPPTPDNTKRYFHALKTLRQPQLDPKVAKKLQLKLQLD